MWNLIVTSIIFATTTINVNFETRKELDTFVKDQVARGIYGKGARKVTIPSTLPAPLRSTVIKTKTIKNLEGDKVEHTVYRIAPDYTITIKDLSKDPAFLKKQAIKLAKVKGRKNKRICSDALDYIYGLELTGDAGEDLDSLSLILERRKVKKALKALKRPNFLATNIEIRDAILEILGGKL